MRELSLSNVTICAVTNDDAELAHHAIERSMASIEFGAAKLLTPRQLVSQSGIEVIEIEPLQGIERYSQFMMKRLAEYIETDFVLIVQWDGFVVNPSSWDRAFLDFDYIGAPWPQFAPGLDVGNGGFSLRSLRLLRALTSDKVFSHHPEDIGICHVNRSYLVEEHGIKFASSDLASRFSHERGGQAVPAFGFHGAFNFISALGEEMLPYLARCPARLFDNRAGYDLIELLQKSDIPAFRWQAGLLLRSMSLSHASFRRRLRMRSREIANWARARQFAVAGGPRSG